jgi:hypothetical protein
MRRLIAIAIVVAGAALPVCAQRGGGGHGGGGHSGGGFAGRSGSFASHSSGGFVSHSAPAFRGSYAPMSRAGLMGSPQAGSSRNLSPAPGATLARRAPVYYRRPPVPVGANRYRLPYVSYYGAGYGYGVAGWIVPDCYDYPDYAGCSYYDDSTYYGDSAYANQAVGPPPPADYPQEAYAAPPVDQSEAAQGDAYRPAYQPPQPEPEAEDAVTLVFKDGRPSEQIHNYMLTRTTLYVQDAPRRMIPVADLDLAATMKVNKDAGVDFQLPGSGR